MRRTLYILVCGTLAFLSSCGHRNDQRNKAVRTKHVDLKTPVSRKSESLNRKPAIVAQMNEDSLRTEKALADALFIAQKNIRKPKFHLELEADTNYNIHVDIGIDNYFTNAEHHLMVRTYEPGSIKIDIFSITNNRFTRVVSHQQGTLLYMNDTIRDINGDGLKDFVVNWYGSCGCCLKGFSDVYIIRPDMKTFSGEIEFINPTFSPREKVVRGIGYGQAGETEMYKYQWNGEMVDTVEYVNYEKAKNGKKTGKIIVTDQRTGYGKFKVLRRLKFVPNEYLKIDGYDWFTGKM